MRVVEHGVDGALIAGVEFLEFLRLFTISELSAGFLDGGNFSCVDCRGSGCLGCFGGVPPTMSSLKMLMPRVPAGR